MTIPDDAFTTPGDGTDRIPGDFRRNAKGQPLVKHPTGTRDLAYDRPSSWIGDDYTGIDPVFARRGSWCHKLTEHVDNGVAWAADLAFVADGVGLGIPADIQHDIARAWERFKAAHAIQIVHVECNVVNDDLKVAGTLDRIVMHDACYRVLDIKTGGKVDKTGYAVQLARYATSIPYDVDTDIRGAWDAPTSATDRQGDAT